MSYLSFSTASYQLIPVFAVGQKAKMECESDTAENNYIEQKEQRIAP